MAELPVQFTKAKSNVEPQSEDKENAAQAHADVRKCLEQDVTLAEYGIDTVLIGSYRRHVSIRRVKDVDVLSKLSQLPDDVTSQDLLDHFEEVLLGEYGDDRVDRQDRSIKVLFPDFDLYVDAVPARPAGIYLEIPGQADDDDNLWVQTNPEQLTELASRMNERYDDEYVPLVKLVRQTRRTNLGKRPGGLFFEILTYHAFGTGLDDSSIASLFAGALRSIATQLQAVVDGGTVADPTMPGEIITVRVTDKQMATAATAFEALATKAEDALSEKDRCLAARKFREILGKNDDGDWVFEMPANCNEDGTARSFAVLSAGDRHVPAGDGRFA